MIRRLLTGAAFALLLSATAVAQVITPGVASPYLYIAQTNNGANAASTAAVNTEEALGVCTYTIPAGKLQKVGDTIHVKTAFDFTNANTDTKTATFRWNVVGGVVTGGATMLTIASSVAAQARGDGEVWIRKTGASTQSWSGKGQLQNNGNANYVNNNSPVSTTDTGPIVITLTGKSNPNAFGAGAVTCTEFAVDFAAGP